MHHAVTVHIIFRLIGGRKNAYRASKGKPERRKTPRRSRQRWKSNIRIYLKEIGQGGVVCINLLRDRDSTRVLVHIVTNFFVFAPCTSHGMPIEW